MAGTWKVLHAQMDDFSNMKAKVKKWFYMQTGIRRIPPRGQDLGGWIMKGRNLMQSHAYDRPSP